MMRRPAKVLLGIATLLPLLLLGLHFVLFMGMFLSAATGHPPPGGDQGGPPPLFFALFGLTCLNMVVLVALLVFYMVDLFRNPRVPDNPRVLWAVVLFFGAPLAMPVYWFLYIWREPTLAEGEAPPTPRP